MDDFERPKTIVEWVLSNSCNYNCSYCLDLLKRGDNPYPNDETIINVCTDIFAHYDSLGRDVIFEFIGGEPTLYEKIPNIGNRLHNYPTNLILRTNGSASLDWWKKSRQFLSKVIISVHQEFCDISHIENVISLLRENDKYHPVEMEILFPVTNHDEVFDRGIKYVKYFRRKYGLGNLQLLYSDFGKGNNTYLPYTHRQWYKFNKMKESIENSFNEDISIDPTGIVIKTSEQSSYTNMTCYAGIDTLVIDPRGNVSRGWCHEGGVIGNIYNMPIEWPKDPVICSKEICKNGLDRKARKE